MPSTVSCRSCIYLSKFKQFFYLQRLIGRFNVQNKHYTPFNGVCLENRNNYLTWYAQSARTTPHTTLSIQSVNVVLKLWYLYRQWPSIDPTLAQRWECSEVFFSAKPSGSIGLLVKVKRYCCKAKRRYLFTSKSKEILL